MKVLWLLIFIMIQITLVGQETINILCLDFKKDGEKFTKGKEFRKSYESVLSNLEYSPRLIEREKLGEILTQIQNENNLIKDFNGEYVDVLNASKVDYLIYGEFYTSSLSDKVEFRSECIKISKDKTTSKIVFSTLVFTEKELYDFPNFENKIRELLEEYSFVEGLGIVETKQLEEINKKLKEKDIQIDELQKEVHLLKSGNSYKILFNGSYYTRRDGSTSIRGGTKESALFAEFSKGYTKMIFV